MSNLNARVTVKGEDVVDDIGDAIEKGIIKAAKDSGQNSIARKMERRAKDRIRGKGKIWTGELLESFETEVVKKKSGATLILRNNAEHALPVDIGAEYGAEGPPLHKLIPWVEAKMAGYRIESGKIVKYDHDEGGTLMTDGGRVRGVTEQLPEATDAEQVDTLSDRDIDGGINAQDARFVTFESGEHAYFQPYKTEDDYGSSIGSVRNEQLFTFISAQEDWQLGPENTYGAFIDPESEELLEGNYMRWIDDADPASEVIENPYFDNAGGELDPTTFVEENEEWLAKTTAIDILLGNNDRSGDNYLIDSDGVLHAIDNGGHKIRDPDVDESLEHLAPGYAILPAHDSLTAFQEYDGLDQAMRDMLTSQNEYLEILLENHKNAILNHAQTLHGKNSLAYRRLDRLFDYDNQEILDFVEQRGNNLIDSMAADTDTLQDAASAYDANDILDELNDKLENLHDDI